MVKCPGCGEELEKGRKIEVNGREIPVFYCQECDKEFYDREEIRKRAEEIEEEVESKLERMDIKQA